MSIANTTYAALSMLIGDGFSDAFTTGDYMKLTATGYNGTTVTGSTDFYLADFTHGNSSVLSGWSFVDLSALGTADTIKFVVSSSDEFKPTYFALDNFLAVPEPSALLISCMSLALLARRRR